MRERERAEGAEESAKGEKPNFLRADDSSSTMINTCTVWNVSTNGMQ